MLKMAALNINFKDKMCEVVLSMDTDSWVSETMTIKEAKRTFSRWLNRLEKGGDENR